MDWDKYLIVFQLQSTIYFLRSQSITFPYEAVQSTVPDVLKTKSLIGDSPTGIGAPRLPLAASKVDDPN